MAREVYLKSARDVQQETVQARGLDATWAALATRISPGAKKMFSSASEFSGRNGIAKSMLTTSRFPDDRAVVFLAET